LQFEWEPSKADANQLKHQVGFEEAATVFGDPFARIAADHKHSDEELRWHIIGMSEMGRVLIVAYTERKDFIRIITARKAEPAERRRYEKNREAHA